MPSHIKFLIVLVGVIVLINFPEIVPDQGKKVTMYSWLSTHIDRWYAELIAPEKNGARPIANKKVQSYTNPASTSPSSSQSDSLKFDWSQYRSQSQKSGKY